MAAVIHIIEMLPCTQVLTEQLLSFSLSLGNQNESTLVFFSRVGRNHAIHWTAESPARIYSMIEFEKNVTKQNVWPDNVYFQSKFLFYSIRLKR